MQFVTKNAIDTYVVDESDSWIGWLFPWIKCISVDNYAVLSRSFFLLQLQSAPYFFSYSSNHVPLLSYLRTQQHMYLLSSSSNKSQKLACLSFPLITYSTTNFTFSCITKIHLTSYFSDHILDNPPNFLFFRLSTQQPAYLPLPISG